MNIVSNQLILKGIQIKNCWLIKVSQVLKKLRMHFGLQYKVFLAAGKVIQNLAYYTRLMFSYSLKVTWMQIEFVHSQIEGPIVMANGEQAIPMLCYEKNWSTLQLNHL